MTHDDDDRDDLDTASEAAPPVWRIEQSVSVWQQIVEDFHADPDFIPDESVIAVALANANVDDPRDLLSSVIDATMWAERRVAEAKQIEAEYYARRVRYTARGERLRALIEAMMRAIGVKNHDGRLARALLVKAPASSLITDEGLIPEEYIKREPVIRKRELLADLKAGVVIPGAALVEGGTTLQVRRR